MRHGPDLLLVTPPSRLAVYQELGRDLAAIEPPVWSTLIATFIRNRGHEVVILDAEAEGLGHEETAARIVATGARLTAFVIYGQQPSASTQCMPGGRRTCELVRAAADLPTLVLGTHPSALAERTLREEPYAFVCQGEGPWTVLGLLQALCGRRRLEDVPGLWWRERETLRCNPPAPNLADLDRELPAQAWDLLDMGLYRAHNWHCFDGLERRQPYASVPTSLGCPYRCAFCCINAPFGTNGIRFWSPEQVVRQIDLLVEHYGIRNLKIPDEMFVLNKRHVLGICDRLIERRYDLNIWAYARIDTVEDFLLERLKRAGFNWLGVGVESASELVRDGVAKGRFSDADIVAAIERIRGHGIHVAANYIFGLPDDTHETMQETLGLALALNTEWANFYCAMAYPGSPLYARAKREGWALPDDPGGPGWVGYSQHAYDARPLPTRHLGATEVLDFRDRAFHRYFTSPTYLALLRRTFGEGAVAHVESMTARPLPRRHHHERMRGRDARLAERDEGFGTQAGWVGSGERQ